MLALECERLRSTGSSAGMAEAVSDMSQAFFSAADTHASLGHMPMASSMCDKKSDGGGGGELGAYFFLRSWLRV